MSDPDIEVPWSDEGGGTRTEGAETSIEGAETRTEGSGTRTGEGETKTEDGDPRTPAGATGSADAERPDAAPPREQTRETRRWHGVTAFALVALGLGVFANQGGLLLASAFGLAFAGYGAVTSAPDVGLALERSIGDDDPDPGDRVQVTVTVRNEGEDALADLRLVDGVPERLTVTDGTPRHGAVLRPGGQTSFRYTVEASRGVHAFEPLTAVARDLSGATERIVRVDAEDRVACEPSLPTDTVPFPLRTKTSQYTGRFPADEGGPGVEFYATREYRPGDPLSRVDWNRTARTGELTTVEFRVERTVRVVLVVDARAEAYQARDPHEATAVERSVAAAGSIYASLTDAGHEVGVASLGPDPCWLSPGRGDEHRVRARRTLASDPSLSPEPPEASTNLYAATETLKGQLPGDVQVVVLSPLCDGHVKAATIRLDAHGYPATVVSPDATATDTPGHTLAAIERKLRIADLRSRAIPVIEWDHDESFERAMAHAQRRWST